MNSSPCRGRSPIVFVLKGLAFVPLLLSAPHVVAETINYDRRIDHTDPETNYLIRNGATLTALGAKTLNIVAQQGTGLVLDGSTVSATTGDGVSLINATATIIGSTLTAQGTGLSLGRIKGVPGGSSATVQDSVIEAGRIGVLAGSLSSFTASNTRISGGTLGMQMANGQVTLQGSTVSGANGIGINPGQDLSRPNTLVLEGSTVEGTNGSAIKVGDYGLASTEALIEVNNGSTLKGANGVLLEVIGSAAANMKVSNSHLVGDVVAEEGATAHLTLQDGASLTGQLRNVENVAINSQAQWVMTGDAQVAHLAMNEGSVRFGQPGQPDGFYRLSVGELSGNGTFAMRADFAQAQGDFLDITGQATGTHQLAVTASGADPLDETRLHMVHAASGDAQFSLVGGPVDLGTWSYDLVKQGDNDWYLDAATKTISPGTATMLALYNAAPTVWYGELTSLRTRMGELRLNPGNAGGWMRAYGNRYDVEHSAGIGYQQSMRGLSLGADAPLPLGDGQWLAGVMAGYSSSDLSLLRGSQGQVDSYYVGTYATWLDQASGWYFDGVLKYNHMRNKAEVLMSDGQASKGNYANNGLGASLELGRHIKLRDGYFIEPFAQFAALAMDSKDYRLSNGMQADADPTRSLLGKLGATAGRQLDLGQGRVLQPYLRAALVHEFADQNEVRVNDNRFNNDLSGSRGELGFGAAASLSDRWQLHADFDFSHGKKIEQPWGASLGVRYAW